MPTKKETTLFASDWMICEYLKLLNIEGKPHTICRYRPMTEIGCSEELLCEYKSDEMVFFKTNIRGVHAFYYKCNLPEEMGDEL